MDDEKEQELLRRKTVKEGADTGVFADSLAKLKPRVLSEEEKASFEERMRRLEAAMKRSRQHSEKN